MYHVLSYKCSVTSRYTHHVEYSTCEFTVREHKICVQSKTPEGATSFSSNLNLWVRVCMVDSQSCRLPCRMLNGSTGFGHYLNYPVKSSAVLKYCTKYCKDLRKRTMAGQQGGSWFGHGGQQGGQAPPPVTSQYPQPGIGGGPQPTGGPTGELVTVFCESNRNYRLTSRADGVVLAYKNQQDPKQYWIKIDIGDRFTDEEGQPGFVLVNKATGMALSHGMDSGAAVTQEPYRANALDNSVLFSSGLNLGKGWHAIRTVTNIHLNLDADHGDKKHGGIQEGNRLVVCNWNNQENQKWMITAVGPED